MIDFDRDTALVGKVLEAIEVRTKATLNNLVNKNTPGFKRHTVRFEDLMQQAQEQGRDLTKVNPVVERDESGPPGVNNVDMLTEMSQLEKLALLQDLFTRRAGGYFSTMNKAIFGR
jgi:flagellar basal body rod protein FlgB